MSWFKGEWYKRRNGGFARFEGVVCEMPCFHHPDLIREFPAYRKLGNLMHRWNGEMMSLPEHRDECAPYDIIQDDGKLVMVEHAELCLND